MASPVAAKAKPSAASGSRLALARTENFTVAGRPAFAFLPEEGRRTRPQPWIFYAPSLPPPVFDFRTYPGIQKAAPAYGLMAGELEMRMAELNPVSRLDVLVWTF